MRYAPPRSSVTHGQPTYPFFLSCGMKGILSLCECGNFSRQNTSNPLSLERYAPGAPVPYTYRKDTSTPQRMKPLSLPPLCLCPSRIISISSLVRHRDHSYRMYPIILLSVDLLSSAPSVLRLSLPSLPPSWEGKKMKDLGFFQPSLTPMRGDSNILELPHPSWSLPPWESHAAHAASHA